MNKTITWILVVTIVIVGLWWLTARDSAGPDSNEPIKIGAPLILSGDFAKYGERAKRSIDLAVTEYNTAHPDNQVEIIYEDTHAEARQALSAYEKLVTVDKVSAIVGPLLQIEMAALMPRVAEDKIPVFSVAPVTKEFRTNTANPLVVWPDPTLEAEQMAEYVHNQGIQTIAILGTQDSWENEVSEAFAAKFVSLGGQVVGKEIVLPTTTDTRLPVTKVIAQKPQAVFLGTYYKFFPFVKSLSEQGYKGRLFSIEIDTYLAEEAGPLANGLQFISPDFYADEFVNRYEEQYGEAPSLPGGQTYDAAKILLSFIAEGKRGNELLTAMASLKEYQGVSGRIIFTDDHRATFPLSIFELQKGKIIRLED